MIARHYESLGRVPAGRSLPTILGWIMTLALPGAALGQTPGYGPMVLDVPANTRALGLGTAYFLAGNESDLLFANPSLLPNATGVQISGTAWGRESYAAQLSGAGEWLGGGIGFGLRVLEYGASSLNPGEIAGDWKQLLEQGNFGAGQLAATVGYGRELGPMMVGASGHLIRDRLGSGGSTAAALDLGVSGEFSGVTVGVSAQNLGPDLKMSGESVSLPQRYTVGATSERTWVGPLDLAGTAAVTYRVDGQWIPAAGLEVAWWPLAGRTLVGRLGYRRIPDSVPARDWTAGAAFEGDNLSLEYAYQGHEGYDAAHHIGVRWR